LGTAHTLGGWAKKGLSNGIVRPPSEKSPPGRGKRKTYLVGGGGGWQGELEVSGESYVAEKGENIREKIPYQVGVKGMRLRVSKWLHSKLAKKVSGTGANLRDIRRKCGKEVGSELTPLTFYRTNFGEGGKQLKGGPLFRSEGEGEKPAKRTLLSLH